MDDIVEGGPGLTHDERYRLHRTSLSQLKDIIVPEREVEITFSIRIRTRELSDYMDDGSEMEEALMIMLEETDDPMLLSVKLIE